MTKAIFGVFGGSGFYELLDNPRKLSVKTRYGLPSDKITLGKIADKNVAFLPRHGSRHHLPPHKIPYRANLAAFKKLGVKYILAPCASGSLRPAIKPGHFVVCDQFVNFTHHRANTFFHGPDVRHIPGADPYCDNLRQAVIRAGRKLKIKVWPKGTVVVIEGPRFSTRAESEFFSRAGWDVVNMTAYPESVLARELEMCYAMIALVTDYDVGIPGRKDIRPVEVEDIRKVVSANNQKIKQLIFQVIENYQPDSCPCHSTLQRAGL